MIADQRELLQFYKEHLTRQLLPFWQQALDRTHGGIFTCYNNEGSALISRDKYIWSQGRFVWLWSRIYDLCRKGVLAEEGEPYLQHAGKTVRFLQEHVLLENGNCAYVLTETGEKQETVPGEGYDVSFYADCFVVLGFVEYVRVTHDNDLLAWALALLDSILRRLEQGNARSEPYPISAQFDPHAVPMIMLNVTQEMADVLRQAGHPRADEMRNVSSGYARRIMQRFSQENGDLLEMIPKENGLEDTLLFRHAAPGHMLESMWFVMTEALKMGKSAYIEQAVKVIGKTFEVGWDAQHGGLLRYVDRSGGAPQGRRIEDRYEQLILDTWDTKIWWPHSEALYSTLLAYSLSGNEKMLDLYRMTHDYVFRVFPHHEGREWIQIRDRAGQPLEKLVALPVKDPFHICRNVLLIIELLNRSSGLGEGSE